MEKMNDLKDLLKHEILDLYSAEEQIIAALPMMIEKAKNPDLTKALQEHLRVTKQQLSRLEQVQNIVGSEEAGPDEKKGLLSRLFKSRQVCRGMQGLIEEGNKVMKEDMDPDVLDAAIIACAQKIEHYEICGYGTARTFARELNLEQVAQLLEQTLNEEYNADDLLTRLAVSHINKEAENASRNNKAGQTSTGRGAARAEGGRVRKEESQMEMASTGSRTTGTTKKSGANDRSTAAPKGGEVSRASSTPVRISSAKRGTAGSRTEAKSGSSGSSRSGSSGRTGNSAGRGGTSARNSRGR